MTKVLERKLSYYQSKVNEEISRFLEVYSRCNNKLISDYYADLQEFILRGGKRLRPSLLIEAYKAVGGVNEEGILRASLSVEFLHNSSLIHDDIMDKDVLRRGKPTFHEIYKKRYLEVFGLAERAVDYGEAIGILGGDTLFELGLKALLGSPFPSDSKIKAADLYIGAYHRIIEGQLLDLTFEALSAVSEEEYLSMVSLKTGWLFKASLLIGGVLGGASDSQLKAFRDFIEPLSAAFQIQDDILGSFGKVEETGKSVLTDIKRGKKTILIVYALELASPDQREFIRRHLGSKRVTLDEVKRIKDIIVQCGALEEARKRAEQLSKMAKDVIKNNSSLLADSREFFTDLCDFVIRRRL